MVVVVNDASPALQSKHVTICPEHGSTVDNCDESSCDDDDEDDDDDDDDDVGSLVDFIVGDDDAIEKETVTVNANTDLDGINVENIISGKRKRKQTIFYEQEMLDTDEYRKMMFCDVPKEEISAVIDPSDTASDVGSNDDDDDDYVKEGEDDDDSCNEDDDDDDDDSSPSEDEQ